MSTYNGRDTSDDFFSSFDDGKPKKPVTAMPRSSAGAGVRKGPPPPPPRPKSTAPKSAAPTSYHANSTTTRSLGASKSSVNKPLGGTAAARRPNGTATTSTTQSSGISSGSYYGQTAGATPATVPTSSRSPTVTSAPAPQVGTGFYGNSTPAPAPVAPAAGTGFYPTPTAAPTQQQQQGGWDYSQQQQQQQQQPQASYMLNTGSTAQPQQAPVAGNGFYQPQQPQQQMQQPPYSQLSGPMDTANTSTTTSTFIPNPNKPVMSSGQPDFENEPPLLEELGINLEHIVAKTRAVVLPVERFGGRMDAEVIQDADLAGPLVLALALGGELLLGGKISFAYIYGFGLFGCLSMTLILNLMSQEGVSVWTVTSILGYALLPVNVLAAVKLVLINVLLNLQTLGRFLAILTVLWSTMAATRLLEQGCDMRDQRYLIAYPIGMLYSAFVLITIF